jgi:hypothetical protein
MDDGLLGTDDDKAVDRLMYEDDPVKGEKLMVGPKDDPKFDDRPIVDDKKWMLIPDPNSTRGPEGGQPNAGDQGGDTPKNPNSGGKKPQSGTNPSTGTKPKPGDQSAPSNGKPNDGATKDPNTRPPTHAPGTRPKPGPGQTTPTTGTNPPLYPKPPVITQPRQPIYPVPTTGTSPTTSPTEPIKAPTGTLIDPNKTYTSPTGGTLIDPNKTYTSPTGTIKYPNTIINSPVPSTTTSPTG